MNGEPIFVSSDDDLDDAIVSVSWLRPRVDHAQFVGYIDRISHRTSYLRRLGSAALVCSYVAAGRIDAYVQGSINAWDIAAGTILIEEAGGRVTDFDGNPVDLSRPYSDILAAGPGVHRIILDEIVRTEDK